jgi:hypothetical protein
MSYINIIIKFSFAYLKNCFIEKYNYTSDYDLKISLRSKEIGFTEQIDIPLAARMNKQ